MLLALKMEKGSHEPRNMGGLYCQKRQGSEFPPRASERERGRINTLTLGQ